MANDYNPDDHNRGGKIAFLFAMFFNILFFIYIAFIHEGVDLKEIPEEIPAEESTESEPVEEGAFWSPASRHGASALANVTGGRSHNGSADMDLVIEVFHTDESVRG